MRTKEEILNGMALPVFFLKCRLDFKFFCEQCLGVTTFGGTHKFQENWALAAMKYNKLIIEAGAGSSKTEVMGAMFTLWMMFKDKNLKILLLTKTMEQSSSNLLSRIKKYITDNELLKEVFTPEDHRTTWNATEIKTRNGCWAKVVPYNENIKGYRGHIIIADEIDSYENTNLFFEHVLSRLYPNGKLIGISTPVGPTKIIGQLKEKQKAGILRGWHFIKTPFLVDEDGQPGKIECREDIKKYKSIWPEMWPVSKLEERWEQGKSNWFRNYMCENLGEVDDALFPMANIVSSFDYNRKFNEEINPEAMYFISADFAISSGPKADFDA